MHIPWFKYAIQPTNFFQLTFEGSALVASRILCGVNMLDSTAYTFPVEVTTACLLQKEKT